jgi:hypothetical protein
MKHIGNLLLVMLMLSLIAAASGCGAKFELSSLEVSPEVCLAGEMVTVSATLTYSGDVVGDYEAELLVDGIIEQTQTLTVEPASSQPLSFTLTKDELGTHIVQLGEITASFTVLEVGNFMVSPYAVEADQPVTVSADLQNVTKTEVTYRCDLLCQGERVATKDITLVSGSVEKVSFNLSEGTPGVYDVQLGNLSGSFKVLKLAEFKAVNLAIVPNPVKVGGVTTVTTDIENMGEVEGIYNASLVVDGAIYETADVTLAGGAIQPVAFSLSKDSPGSYNIEIGGQEAILDVVQPVRLPTGIILEDESLNSYQCLKINNETAVDLVVVLSSGQEPKTPLLALYVRSGDSYTFWKVVGGTYILYFTFGEDWDNNSKKFLSGAIYNRLPDELIYEQWATVRRTWWVNFTTEVLAISTISSLDEDEFPALE